MHFLGIFKDIDHKIKRLYDFILPTCITLEIMVTVSFWILFLINPYLVKSDYIPNTTIFGYSYEFPKHLFPLLILLIEQTGLSIERSWSHHLFLICFGFVYGALNESLIIYDQTYLYPFFKKIAFCYRLCFFLASTLINIFFYEIIMYFKVKELEKMTKHKNSWSNNKNKDLLNKLYCAQIYFLCPIISNLSSIKSHESEIPNKAKKQYNFSVTKKYCSILINQQIYSQLLRHECKQS